MPIDRDEFKRIFTAKYIVTRLKILIEEADTDATRLNALIFAAKASGHYVERSSVAVELPESVYVSIELGLSEKSSITRKTLEPLQPLQAIEDKTGGSDV